MSTKIINHLKHVAVKSSIYSIKTLLEKDVNQTRVFIDKISFLGINEWHQLNLSMQSCSLLCV